MAYFEWERFWSNVAPTNERGCRLWTGGKHDRAGYGAFRSGSGRLAHRWVYASANGAIPDGMDVIHKCDERRCVAIDHLMLGTHAENMLDMSAKGRSYTGDQVGEANGGAKLTDATVAAMRAEYAAGGVLQRELGLRYGVDQSNVSLIVNRKKWSHL